MSTKGQSVKRYCSEIGSIALACIPLGYTKISASPHFTLALDACYTWAYHSSEQAMPAAAPLFAERIADVTLQLWSVTLSSTHIFVSTGGASGPGCVVWESGLALAEYLSQHYKAGMCLLPDSAPGIKTFRVAALYMLVQLAFMPSYDPKACCRNPYCHAGQVRGCRCLDLGAGTGIVGICAALLGADVTLTDTASCLPLLKQNVESHNDAITEAGRPVLSLPPCICSRLCHHHSSTSLHTLR